MNRVFDQHGTHIEESFVNDAIRRGQDW